MGDTTKKGGVPSPEDRDAPMTFEKARQIARSVSHRVDGTSQAFAALEDGIVRLTSEQARFAFQAGERLGESLKRIRELETPPPERVDTNVMVECSKCGHKSTLFIEDKKVRADMARAFTYKIRASFIIHFWRFFTAAFMLGLLFGWLVRSFF